jgi:hypothetical protein
MARKLIAHCDRIITISETAKVALDEYSNVVIACGTKAHITLATLKQLKPLASDLPTAQKEAIERLPQQYLQTMDEITDVAGADIIKNQRACNHDQGETENIFDWIFRQLFGGK